MSFDIKVEKPA